MDNNLGLFAFLLLIMVMLPLSARVTQAGHGVKKSAQRLCLKGSWIKVGSFRFWKRSECVRRRQMTPQSMLHGRAWPQRPGVREGSTPTTTKASKESESFLPSEEGGPPRSKDYNPNYGHEPYWANGDWVFDKDPYEKNDTLYMCGVRCPRMYSEYGKVCARHRKPFPSNHIQEYRTFKNYCEFKNQDCGNSTSLWEVMYRGECIMSLKGYHKELLKSKVIEYITNFMSLYPEYNNKTVGFCKDCPKKFLE